MKNIIISFWNFAPSLLEVCCLANIELGYIFRIKRKIMKKKILTLMDNLIYLLSTNDNEEYNFLRDDREFLEIFIAKYLRLRTQIQTIRQRARNRQNPIANYGIRINNRIPIPILRRLRRLRIREYRR